MTTAGSEQRPSDVQPFEGRVAVITGGARGQGRSHAVELARLGADIAVADLCHDLDSVGYALSSEDDLAETVRLVEAQGRRCVSAVADVRDLDAMLGFVSEARDALGSVDILVANAGISTLGSICTMDAAQWSETIDTNLTGVFNAMRAVAPHMRRQRWGRIIGISSMMGRSSNPGIPAYVASKWGVIGLCKSVAFELAAFGVTVNAIAPGNISTPMIHNDTLYGLMRPDLDHPTREDVEPGMTALHVQPVPWLEPEEVTAAVVFLASDGARHITGSVIDVDAGASARFTG
ncbi:MAG: mycofactocin-coupled SDR family oxidoreductase [Acidimicrobiales bacterium]|jgi:SDR family mycofactocin-dependent oxidoreductase